MPPLGAVPDQLQWSRPPQERRQHQMGRQPGFSFFQIPRNGRGFLFQANDLIPGGGQLQFDLLDAGLRQVGLGLKPLQVQPCAFGLAFDRCQSLLILFNAIPDSHELVIVGPILFSPTLETQPQHHRHGRDDQTNGAPTSAPIPCRCQENAGIHPPRMPFLNSSVGGVSPTQTLTRASAKSSPSIVPLVAPLTTTVVPLPGTRLISTTSPSSMSPK